MAQPNHAVKIVVWRRYSTGLGAAIQTLRSAERTGPIRHIDLGPG